MTERVTITINTENGEVVENSQFSSLSEERKLSVRQLGADIVSAQSTGISTLIDSTNPSNGSTLPGSGATQKLFAVVDIPLSYLNYRDEQRATNPNHEQTFADETSAAFNTAASSYISGQLATYTGLGILAINPAAPLIGTAVVGAIVVGWASSKAYDAYLKDDVNTIVDYFYRDNEPDGSVVLKIDSQSQTSLNYTPIPGNALSEAESQQKAMELLNNLSGGQLLNQTLIPKEIIVNQSSQVDSASSNYIVQEGDTISRIAQDLGLTTENLIANNPWLESEGRITDNGNHILIRPDEKLSIPKDEITSNVSINNNIDDSKYLINFDDGLINYYDDNDGWSFNNFNDFNFDLEVDFDAIIDEVISPKDSVNAITPYLDLKINISPEINSLIEDNSEAWRTDGSAIAGNGYSLDMPLSIINEDGAENTFMAEVATDYLSPGIDKLSDLTSSNEIKNQTSKIQESQQNFAEVYGPQLPVYGPQLPPPAPKEQAQENVGFFSKLVNAFTSAFTTRQVDPLVLDLDNDGVELIHYNDSKVSFDVDNDNYKENTGWVNGNDGILVHDKDEDGIISDITETISEYYQPNESYNEIDEQGRYFADGLEALKALDSNDDNIFNNQDDLWNTLRVWQDEDEDGITDEGELKTLDEHNIESIDLNRVISYRERLEGNPVLSRSTMTMKDGTKQDVAAVDFATNPIGYEWNDIYEQGSKIESEDGQSSSFIVTSYEDTTVYLETEGVNSAYGNIGNDTLIGDDNNNWLMGGVGSDTLIGGAGNDILLIDGQDLNENIDGGEGRDVVKVISDENITFNLALSNVEVFNGAGGDDVIMGGGLSNAFISAGAGDDIVIGGASDDALAGEDGNDMLDGRYGDDTLRGHRGEDLLIGGEGNDYLDGGLGNDDLRGGAGSDILIGGQGDDKIDGGEGFDMVEYKGKYDQYSYIQNQDGTILVTDTSDGSVDTIKNVERLRFDGIDIDLGDVDSLPLPVKDSLVVSQSDQLIIDQSQILANDFSTSGKEFSVRNVSDAVGGTVELREDGKIIFTPDPYFTGTMSFDYSVVDEDGKYATISKENNDGSIQTADLKAQVNLVNESDPSDPLYYDQWYLSEIRIKTAWEDYSGQGVDIGIFEGEYGEPFKYDHEDLNDNVSQYYLENVLFEDDVDSFSNHSTLVAGVIAAEKNDIGSIGIAYNSNISSFTWNPDIDGLMNMMNYDVANNSWGTVNLFGDDFIKDFGDNVVEKEKSRSFENAVEFGRDGLGTNIIFAGGNSRKDGDNVNYHNAQNSRFVSTIGSINQEGDLSKLVDASDPFSNPGSAILVSAPGSNIKSTANLLENHNGSTFGGDFESTQGTSFSAPITSGVVALMLEANPYLAYRDVQEILAKTARIIDDENTVWLKNGDTTVNDGSGMHYSEDYGFGIIDAHSAVRMAEIWDEINNSINESSIISSNNSSQAILDNSEISSTINVNSDIDIEHVEVFVDIDHTRIGDLIITLVSPDGTESILVNRPGKTPGSDDSDVGLEQSGLKFNLSTTNSFGENGTGDWILKVKDAATGETGTLNSWDLKLYGQKDEGNDDYIFTDEFADSNGRTISDNGGNDSINAVSLLTDSTINLNAGSNSNIAGKTVHIDNGVVIEDAYAGDGDDVLIGNEVDNILFGGRGNNTLTGNAGSDKFLIIKNENQNDVITDFDVNDANEKIDLTKFKLNSFDDLSIVAQGNDTVINLPDNQTITLKNISPASINSDNFVGFLNETIGTIGTIDGDNIYKDQRDDIIDAKEGDDYISAGKGNNIIAGGLGDDVFFISQNSNKTDIITDFEVGNSNEVISLRNFKDIKSINDLLITQDGLNSVIDLKDGQKLILENVNKDDLGNKNFLFFGQIIGTEGDDKMVGSDFPDLMSGKDGDDIIRGLEWDDDIYGGEGNDVLRGDHGDDKLYGDGGNDTLVGGIGNDTIFGGEGDDIISTGGSDLVGYDTGSDNKENTAYGQGGNDEIHGDFGNDTIFGGAGEDIIIGRDGDDKLYGNENNDTIYGENGEDFIFGGSGNDLIFGGTGNDVISGEENDDEIYGGQGEDVIYGNSGDDTIYGGDNDDIIVAGTGNNHMFGESGNDIFVISNNYNANDIIYDFDVNSEYISLYSLMGSVINSYDNLSVYQNGNDAVVNIANYQNIILKDVDASLLTQNHFLSVNHAPEAFADLTDKESVINTDFSFNVENVFYDQDGDDLTFSASLEDGSQLPDWLNFDANSLTFSGTAPNEFYLEKIKLTATDTQGASVSRIFNFDIVEGLIIQGHDGDDVIYGSNGNDDIFGGSGNDRIEAIAGENLIDGEEGNDLIFGGSGSDGIFGGSGDDIIVGESDNYAVIGGADLIYGEEGNDTILGGAGSDEIYGGEGNDEIQGDVGNDILIGENGDDIIRGNAGEDFIIGGYGNDVISGGEDNDTIVSGLGNDTLYGDSGNDIFAIQEDAGSTTIIVDFEYDNQDERIDLSLISSIQTPNDFTINSDGNDVLIEFANNQTIILRNTPLSSIGYDDFIYSLPYYTGTSGDDIIESQNVMTFGLEGNDTINTGSEDSIIFGGSGDDRIETIAGNNFIEGEAGEDLIFGGSQTDEIHGGDDNDTIVGEADNYSLEGGADLIYGDNGDDIILGGAGDDELYGGQGNDELQGDTGNDIIHGGTGDDTIRGNVGSDVIYGGTGQDIIHGGQDNDIIYGGEDGDYIDGEDGDDEIYGDSGNDTIIISGGNDTIYGGEGDNTFILTRNTDSVTVINDFKVESDKIDFNNYHESIELGDFNITQDGSDTLITFRDNQIIKLTNIDSATLSFDNFVSDLFSFLSDNVNSINGTASADYIFGGNNLDTINGLDGNDTIYGNEGDDFLHGGNGDDKLYGGDGDDSLYGNGTRDLATLEVINHDTNTGNNQLYGGAGDDVLLGGSGNDYLDGGEGHDIIFGEGGNDIIIAGSSAQIQAGSGDDIIVAGDYGVSYLWGESGLDTFKISLKDADYYIDYDVIYDFELNEIIDLSEIASVQKFSDINVYQQTNGDTYLNFAGQTLILSDFDANNINASHFVFKNTAPVVASEVQEQIAETTTEFSFQIPNNIFSDANEDSLTYNVTLNDDSDLPSWLTFDNNTLTLSGTPNNEDIGELLIKVTASDGEYEASTNFSLSINRFNNVPVATIISASTDEDNNVTIDVLAGANDVDGDILSISNITDPQNGTAQIVDGKIIYTPDADYNGSDSFSYTILDDKGASVTKDLIVNINPTNDDPIARTDVVITAEEQEIFINPLEKASDVDGDTIILSEIEQPQNGVAEIIDGQVKYTPNQGFKGQDIITYTISDGNGGFDTKNIAILVDSSLADSSSSNKVVGTDNNDYLEVSTSGNIILGLDGDDFITNYSGDNKIYGGDGNNIMVDRSSKYSDGANTFIISEESGSRDTIVNFSYGVDKIDLSNFNIDINEIKIFELEPEQYFGNIIIKLPNDQLINIRPDQSGGVVGIQKSDFIVNGDFDLINADTLFDKIEVGEAGLIEAGNESSLIYDNFSASNILVGSEQDDLISVLYGDDVIDAKGGNDIIYVGRGSKEITGGDGQDTFILYNKRWSNDTITDYNPNEDIIDFSFDWYGLDRNFNGHNNIFLVEQDNDLVFYFDDDNVYDDHTVTLSNINYSQLNFDNIVGLEESNVTLINSADFVLEPVEGDLGSKSYIIEEKYWGNYVINDFDITKDKVDLSQIGNRQYNIHDLIQLNITNQNGDAVIDFGLGEQKVILKGIDASLLDISHFIGISDDSKTTEDVYKDGYSVAVGGLGEDILIADTFESQLYGHDGDDILLSGMHTTMYGGDGNDLLIDTTQISSELTGGAGNDIFKFVDKPGYSFSSDDRDPVITDFTISEDKIDLSFFADNFNKISFEQKDSDVLITVLDTEFKLLLKNINKDDISESNFIFTESSGWGSNFDETIIGSYIRDALVGYGGDDILQGGEGKDFLDGGSGNDIIDGGDGNDIINGGEGNNILTGGLGNDEYIINNDWAIDVITDFSFSEDTLTISSWLTDRGVIIEEKDSDLYLYLDNQITVLENRSYESINFASLGIDEGDVVLEKFSQINSSGQINIGFGNNIITPDIVGNNTYKIDDKYWGEDIINNFDIITDKIDLTQISSYYNEYNIADLVQLNIQNQNGDTIIDFGKGYQKIILKGINASDLTISNFIGITDNTKSTEDLNLTTSDETPIVFGGLGNDTLVAAADYKDDQLYGYDGNDSLSNGFEINNTLLEGGSGNDTFIINDKFNHPGLIYSGTGVIDTITDFNYLEDTIDLSNIRGFSLESSEIFQSGDDLILTIGQNQKLALKNVNRDQLSEDNLVLFEPTVINGSGDIFSSESDSIVIGSDLSDSMSIYGDNNVINAKGEDDTIYFGGNNNEIDAGDGNDLISFYANSQTNNSITGGQGSDIFSFQYGSYQNGDIINWVEDFETSNFLEKIDLRTVQAIKQFSDLNVYQEGNDSIIAINDNNKIVLRNTNVGDLDGDNFMFYSSHYVGSELNDEIYLYQTPSYNSPNTSSDIVNLEGKGGDDKLYSPYYGDNEYILDGGDGNDELYSMSGSATLIGGAGDDKFVIDDFDDPYAYPPQDGVITTQTINDFEADNLNEKIIINSMNVTSFSDLVLSGQADDVLVELTAGGNQIILKNTLISDLSADNFEVNFSESNPNSGYSGQFSVVDGKMEGTEAGEFMSSSYPYGDYASEIYGLGGDDNIQSQGYELNIFAGSGNDTVMFNDYSYPGMSTTEIEKSATYFYGEDGNDDLVHYSYNVYENIMDGGAGNDIFSIYDGSPTLIGGSGNDLFDIKKNPDSTITIEDFELNNPNEIIDLSYFEEVNNLEDLNLEQDGLDAIINLPNNQKIILKNTNKDDLSINNFAIVLSNKEQSGELQGTSENDLIHGYGGDDIIDAGAGSDIIKGGQGTDSFIISSDPNSVDEIRDFDINNEKITLKDFSNISEFSDLDISYHKNEYDYVPEYFALVNLGDGQFLKIKNAIETNPITANNFIFETLNTAPTATIDTSTTLEDNSVVIDVLAGANDVDGDVVVIDSVGSPTNGTAEIIDGKITYTPNDNYFGSDSFSYTLIDGNGGSVTTTLNIDISSVNDNPVATIIAATVNEDSSTTIDVLAGSSDIDGDILVIDSISEPTNGSAEVVEGKIVYTPNTNYNGSDSFNYTISDGNGGLVTKTLTIEVSEVNDIPTATITSVTTSEDNGIVIDVLSGASDVDGDNLSIKSVTNGANGTAQIIDGKIHYTPNANYNGSDSVSYVVTDDKGAIVTTILNIVVEAINDVPTVSVTSSIVSEDGVAVIDVLAGSSDVDGDVITLDSVSTPSNGTTQVIDGKITYTPNENYFGSDSFEYSVSDGNGGITTTTLNIDVSEVNDIPVVNVSLVLTNEDNAVVIDVLATASDADGDNLTIASVSGGTNGLVQIIDGKITYTPNENYFGSDSFEYTVSDGNGGIVTTTLNVDIVSVNDAPVVLKTSSITSEDNVAIIDVLSEASDVDGDNIVIESVSESENGSVQIVDGKIHYTPNSNYYGTDSFEYTVIDSQGARVTTTLNVAVSSVNDIPITSIISSTTNEDIVKVIDVLAGSNDADGDNLIISSITNGENGTTQIIDNKIVYTPNNNYFGQDSFEYTVSDGNGGETTTTLNIEIASVNDTPVTTIISSTVSEDSSVTIDVLLGASDIDGDDLFISEASNPTNGITQIVDGKIVYTPNNDYFGSDSFEYTISDGNGGLTTKTLNVTVNSINDIPTATVTSVTTAEDNSIAIDVLSGASDVEDGNNLSIKSITNGNNGNAQIIGGKIVYTPNENYNGTDSLSYVIVDSDGGEVEKILNIEVTSVNDLPTALITSSVVDEDGVLTIDVLSGSFDPDGDLITITSVSNPDSGTVQIIDGKITYTPNANYFGSDSFEYTISDGNGGIVTKTLNVEVNSINDIPVASITSLATNEDNSLTIDVLAGASDADGDSISLDSVTNGNNGDVAIVDNKVVYTPNDNYFGSDSFTYTISDGNGGIVTTTLNINIISVNDAPVTTITSSIINEDNVAIIDVLSGVSDADGDDNIVIESVSDANNGTTQIIDGKVYYTPNDNYFGSDNFEYVVIDNQGARVTTTLNVTINPVNDVPVTNIVSSITNEDNVKVIDVLAGASDVDGDNLVISSVTDGQNGTTQIINGKIIYTPNENYFGSDSFEYTVSDNQGGVVTTTLNIDVNGVNDIPTATITSSIVDEDGVLTIDVLAYANDVESNVLSIHSVSAPNNGTVQIIDNKIVYAPNVNYNGMDNFDYAISDEDGGIVTKTLNVTIKSINDTPIAVNDDVTLNEDGVAIIDALGNDFDAEDSSFEKQNISIITAASFGTVVLNDDLTFTYTPNKNRNGQDSFTYQVTDSNGAVSNTATVNINVNPVNDNPFGKVGNQHIMVGEEFSVSLADLFSDIEGDDLTFMANVKNQIGLPDGLSLNEETWELSGTLNESGKTVIEVHVSDSNGGIYSTTFGVMANPNLADRVTNIPEIKVTNGSNNNDSLSAVSNQQDLISAGSGDDEINYVQDNVWQDTGNVQFFAWNTYSGDLVSVSGKLQSFDSFDGGAGNDTLNLSDGNDVLFLDDSVSSSLSNSARISGIEIINGGLGDDIIDLSSLNYEYGDVTLNGGDGDDVLWSNSGDDILNGGDGNDNLQGGGGNDVLNGDAGDDILKGYDGDETLTGGTGADTLTGGFGFDSFNFTALNESTINNSDLITDFTQGEDSINFSNLGFTAIQAGEGSGTVLGYSYDQGTDITTIEDANSDFAVMLSGKIDLANDDFNF